MTDHLDATGIAQLAVRLGIASDDQTRDCLIELDDPAGRPDQMVRVMERKGYLTPFQGAKLLKGETDGYFLGGYRLLYRIASGSFGRVYRGDDPRTGQVVAIKVLRSKWAQDKQKVDLFLREGKVGLTIRHPNIVSIMAVSQDSKTGQYYIVLEFIEGGNLRDILQIRKKLAPDEALRILEECAAGLMYSHSRGLSHRDIKPTNILISAQGQAKLVDFGMAEISQGSAMSLERKDEKEDDVAVDRTVDYAGLEKATGQKSGDIRSDIYFLGAVLYECLTGEPVMAATKDRHVRMQARRYEEVEDTLRRKGPGLGLTPPLIRLLAKMLAFAPAERFQTPTLLLEAVKKCRGELSGDIGASARIPPGPPTVFAVESNPKLQDAFREKLKSHGYRVLLSIDPEQAIKRYQQSPYHALIIDCGTVGRDGVTAYNRVLREADGIGLDLGAILILSEEQAAWSSEATATVHGAVLVRPVTMKMLIEHLYEVTPQPAQAEG